MSTLDDAVTAALARQGGRPAPRGPWVPPKPLLTPSASDRRRPYIAAIPASSMTIDRTYQRDLNLPWVREKVAAWDPTLLGVLEVSDRGDDTFAVIDGQQRRELAMRADPRGQSVPLVCNVHRGLTVADEALLFHMIDAGRRRLTGWDRWKARKAAGDKTVAAIEAAAAEFGLRCLPGQTDGYVGAVGALEQLHAVGGPQHVRATLAVLHAAHDRAWPAYQAPIVAGVGLLLHRYSELDPQRLVTALGKTTPQQLRAQAVTYREVDPAPLYRSVAQVLVNRINTRAPRLPDLRDAPTTGR